jgi:hypothetical protein
MELEIFIVIRQHLVFRATVGVCQIERYLSLRYIVTEM